MLMGLLVSLINALVVGAVGWTVAGGVEEPGPAGVFGGVVALGEAARVS